MDLSVKFCPWPSSEELVVLLISSVLGNKGFEDDTNCYRIPSFQISTPSSSGSLTLYIPFQLILALHLLIMQVIS